MITVIDIETYANLEMLDKLPPVKAKSNLKDPAKIEADIKAKKAEQINKMALNPLYGKIACIGYASKDGVEVVVRSEKEMLTDFFNRLSKISKLITYNGNSFDLPFIWKRALILGVFNPCKDPVLSHYTKRYNTVTHVDLMQLWAGWNTQNFAKLDDLANALFGEKKVAFDFREIPELLKSDAGIAKLEEYCLQDCKLTYKLYEKIGSVL